MQFLSEEEYKEHLGKIPDNEVSTRLGKILSKQLKYIADKRDDFNEVENTRINLFISFGKQYNTIIALSKKTSYVSDPHISYLDIRSINILIRSCHELYLTDYYLFSPIHFTEFTADEEKEFKHLCYKYSGYLDLFKTNKIIKSALYAEKAKESKEHVVEQKNKILNEIRSNKIFNKLNVEVQNQIKKNGSWKNTASEALSWSKLADLSLISNDWAKFQYHHLSSYTHCGYNSILLESNHNHEVDGLLMYLYVLASYFITQFSLSHKLSSDFYAIEERCLVQEFLGIGVQGYSIFEKNK